MRYERLTQPVAAICAAAARGEIEIDAIGAHTHLEVILRGTYTLAAGSASGTVINDPLSPIAAISSLDIVRSPERPGGSLRLDSTALQLLYAAGFLMEHRAPPRTAAPAGAAATHEVLCKFYIPCSLFNAGPRAKDESLQPQDGVKSYKATVVWPSTLAGLRDALYTSNDRTLTIPSTNPLRVEIALVRAVADEGGNVPKPIMEMGLMVTRSKSHQTGKNQTQIPMDPGDVPLAIIGMVRDNAARSSTFFSRVVAKLNGREFYNDDFAELLRKNAADYAARDGDWLAGFFALDFQALAAFDLTKLDAVASTGGAPWIELDSGSTAPTSTSDTYFLLIFARSTAYGAKVGKALAA